MTCTGGKSHHVTMQKREMPKMKLEVRANLHLVDDGIGSEDVVSLLGIILGVLHGPIRFTGSWQSAQHYHLSKKRLLTTQKDCVDGRAYEPRNLPSSRDRRVRGHDSPFPQLA